MMRYLHLLSIFLLVANVFVQHSALAEKVKDKALLSDNIRPRAHTELFPVGTPVLRVGATYQWVTQGEYRTDKETLSTGRPAHGKPHPLFDGILGEGSGTQTWSEWSGEEWATLRIDLKEPYAIDSVDVWAFRDPVRDTAYVDILMSLDGRVFRKVGVAENNKAPRDIEQFVPLSCVLTDPIKARYIELRMRRLNSSRQQQIGEIAIWGRRNSSDNSNVRRPDERRPITLVPTPIQSGAVKIAWSDAADLTDGIAAWHVYRSDQPFTEIGSGELQRVATLEAATTEYVDFPLRPGTTYYYGVTAVYDGVESPTVECLSYTTPLPFECKTFGDMLAINHYWGWSIEQGADRDFNEDWENVALEMLGNTHFKDIRWFRSPPDVLQTLRHYGIGMLYSKLDRLKPEGIWAAHMLNEPDLLGIPMMEYLERFKAFHKNVRAIDPDIRVIGPSSGLEDSSVEWLDQLLSMGAGKYLDVLDLHTYCKAVGGHEVPHGYPKGSPEALYSNMSKIRAVLEKHDLHDIPIISTEFGYTEVQTGNPAGPITPTMKSQYLVRGLIIHYVLGFKRVYVYSFYDWGDDLEYTEHNFGLVSYDLQKKPAYYAVENMADQLASCVLIGELAGSAHPTIGYQFYDQNREEYVAVLWDGTAKAAGQFETDADEVRVVDMMGNIQQVLVDENQRFGAQYGPAPVYLRSTSPIRQIDQKHIASTQTSNGEMRLEMQIDDEVIVFLPDENQLSLELMLINPTSQMIEGRVVLRDTQEQTLEAQAFQLEPHKQVSLTLQFSPGEAMLQPLEIVVAYDGTFTSASERQTIYLRRLTAVDDDSVTARFLMHGVDEPVYVLANQMMEVTIDPSRGGRVLEIIDRKTGKNQIRMDYEILPNLPSIRWSYGIWYELNGELRNAEYTVLDQNPGSLTIQAITDSGLRVRNQYELQDDSLVMDVMVTNDRDESQTVKYYIHPEYTVGGTADSVTDVLILPLKDEVVQMPYWTGLGDRRNEPLIEGWWAVFDQEAGVALEQFFDVDAFRQPRIWYGRENYNIELTSSEGLELQGGEHWEGRVLWKLHLNTTVEAFALQSQSHH